MSAWKKMRENVEYAVGWVLLNLLGPAQLDDDHDPLLALKRRYGHVKPRQRNVWR